MQPQRSGQPFQPRDRVQPKPLCIPPVKYVCLLAIICVHAGALLWPGLVLVFLSTGHFQ